MKFDPFGTAFERITREEIDLSVAIVAAVREAVGPHVELFIECHGRFDPLLGGRIGKLMEPFDPGWFEEPVRSSQTENMAALTAKLSFPVAGGESLQSLDAFLTFMSARAAQIIQPDPVTCGGISELKKICALAQAHHIQVAPHNAQGPVCTAICTHLAACTPNHFVQEVFDDFNVEWEKDLVSGERFEVKDGYMDVPEAPGLGIDLNVEEIEKHPYSPGHWLPLFKDGWEERSAQEG